jgi:hypothetical protein
MLLLRPAFELGEAVGDLLVALGGDPDVGGRPHNLAAGAGVPLDVSEENNLVPILKPRTTTKQKLNKKLRQYDAKGPPCRRQTTDYDGDDGKIFRGSVGIFIDGVVVLADGCRTLSEAAASRGAHRGRQPCACTQQPPSSRSGECCAPRCRTSCSCGETCWERFRTCTHCTHSRNARTHASKHAGSCSLP